MLAKGLLAEVDAALRPDAPVWRKTGTGPGTTLVATAAGLAAIGVEPEAEDGAAEGAEAASPADAGHQSSESAPAAKTRIPRPGTKQGALIAMLRAPVGATNAEIALVTGWQPHTVRGAMAGALKGARAHGQLGEDRRPWAGQPAATNLTGPNVRM